MQSPFSNGGSPTPDGLTETRFTYVPAVTAGGDGSIGQGVDPNPAAGISQVAAGAGKTGREGGGEGREGGRGGREGGMGSIWFH